MSGLFNNGLNYSEQNFISFRIINDSMVERSTLIAQLHAGILNRTEFIDAFTATF